MRLTNNAEMVEKKRWEASIYVTFNAKESASVNADFWGVYNRLFNLTGLVLELTEENGGWLEIDGDFETKAEALEALREARADLKGFKVILTEEELRELFEAQA
jgi:hypothetical protein